MSDLTSKIHSTLKCELMIWRYSADSIRDRSNALHTKSGCMAAIFTYSQNHRLKAWQKWASMYGLSSIFAISSNLGNESEIKELVRSNLKDPESAQFKEAVVCADEMRASILWNAKNSMGGYGDWEAAEFVKIYDEWKVVKLNGGPNYCDGFSLRDPKIIEAVSKGMEHPESAEFFNTYIFPDGERACVTWREADGFQFSAILKNEHSEWLLESLYGDPGGCSVSGLPQLEAEAKFLAKNKEFFNEVSRNAEIKAIGMLMKAKNISTEEADRSSDWQLGCMSLINDFSFKSEWAVEVPIRMREDEIRNDDKIKLSPADPLKTMEQNARDLQAAKFRLEKGQCEEPAT